MYALAYGLVVVGGGKNNFFAVTDNWISCGFTLLFLPLYMLPSTSWARIGELIRQRK